MCFCIASHSLCVMFAVACLLGLLVLVCLSGVCSSLPVASVHRHACDNFPEEEGEEEEEEDGTEQSDVESPKP